MDEIKYPCPRCHQTNTRLMYRTFETERRLCLDCLISFNIEWNILETSIPTANVPRRG